MQKLTVEALLRLARRRNARRLRRSVTDDHRSAARALHKAQGGRISVVGQSCADVMCGGVEFAGSGIHAGWATPDTSVTHLLHDPLHQGHSRGLAKTKPRQCKTTPAWATEGPAALSANTRPSSSELEARRLAPCRPEQATSPQAYRPCSTQWVQLYMAAQE